MSSPRGPSTLTTSAPRSASSIVAYGPARIREKSATSSPRQRARRRLVESTCASLSVDRTTVRPSRPSRRYCARRGAVKSGARGRHVRHGLEPGEVGADLARGLQQQRQVVARSARSTEVSAACTLTLIAGDDPAGAVPQRRGHRRMPGASCSSVSAQPAARTSRSSASSSARSGCQPGRQPGAGRLGQHRVQLRPAAGRRAAPCPARSAAPGTGCRSAPPARRSSAPRPGRRRRCPSRRAGRSSRTRRCAATSRSRCGRATSHSPMRLHVGDAEVEHPRGQREAAGRPPRDVAELLQGEQDPAGGRPGQRRSRRPPR